MCVDSPYTCHALVRFSTRQFVIGKPAPPSVFFNGCGEPRLFFVPEQPDCQNPERLSQWRQSVCATHDLFQRRHGESAVPFHFLRHAPVLQTKESWTRVAEDPAYQEAFKRALAHKFRSPKDIQYNHLYVHTLLQRSQPTDNGGAVFGWDEQMGFVAVSDSPGDIQRLRKLADEMEESPRLFYSTSDRGWRLCSTKDALLGFMLRGLPEPSSFEVPDATGILLERHASSCTDLERPPSQGPSLHIISPSHSPRPPVQRLLGGGSGKVCGQLPLN